MVREPMEHIENYMDCEKSTNPAFLRFLRVYGTFWEKRGGGDGGIRTLDTPIEVWFLSRELVSAPHPRLRTQAASRGL